MNRTIFSFFVFSLALVIVFSAACGGGADNSNRNVQTNTTDSASNEVGNKFFTIEFKSEPASIESGKNTKLSFALKNDRDEPIRELQIVHEKPMHLLIVSDDLDEFYHVHPESQPDGSFAVNFTFPNAGGYRLYADFTPKGSEQVVKPFPVSVSGAPRLQKDLKADETLEKTVGDLRVVMKPSGELITNRELMLEFQVFDAKTNAPVIDLENYLGAKAHFVVISKDLEEFVHVHPMSTDNVKGEEHSHKPSEEKLNGAAAQSIVSAHVNFSKPGIYKLWAQFKRGGKVATVPFAFEIKQGEAEKRLEKVQIPEGAFKIVVSKDGFTPEEVTFEKGRPLKLAFFRVDAENCADEVVFKDLNIRKKLPLGEVVIVEINSLKGKEANFTCGMNMYKGKIIVE